MEVTNIIISISISLVVGGGTGICVFKWFGKRWIGHWFDKDLERYKQQLDLLKMQNYLQFSKVYTKQAEYIEGIYERLAKIDLANNLMKAGKFADNEKREETLREYSVMIGECSIYVSLHGIFLSDSMRSKLDMLINTLAKEVWPQLSELEQLSNDEFLRRVKELPEYDARAIMDDLRKEFELVLGINKPNKLINETIR